MPEHEIAPFFDEKSKVLILGSFPSPKSREAGFYYAHPQNRMWKVLARVFEDPFPETAESRKAFLRRSRLAMWDVISSCEISGASDSSIRNAVPNDLGRILAASDIRAVFTTGAKASSLYERFQAKTTKVPHIALPSTSPANAAASGDFLAASYLKIRLFTLQELPYRERITKLRPELPEEQFIGIRPAELQSLCGLTEKDPGLCEAFRRLYPHRFFEENELDALLAGQAEGPGAADPPAAAAPGFDQTGA